jgi:plasmid stabilization system protein ParE
MGSPLRFHPLVAEDIRLASEWYDEISLDLGNRFRRAVDGRFDAVELRPELFGRVAEELRAVRLEGFPYLIIYRIEQQAIEILGVFHAAADPQKWHIRAR